MKGRSYELCDGEASLYCPSDSAFLCWNCNAKVHQANFLIARHVRRTVCSLCKSLTGNCISGPGSRLIHRICRSCSPVDDLNHGLSSSSSSACISNAKSCSKSPKKIDFDRLKTERAVSSSSISTGNSNFPVMFATEAETQRSRKIPTSLLRSKAEGILVNWCRKLGLRGHCAVVVPVFPKASFDKCDKICKISNEVGLGLGLEDYQTGPKGLGVVGWIACEGRVLPLRVRLAVWLWWSLRWKGCGDKSASTCQVLKRLEEISGVPAKLIVAATSQLSRVFHKRRSPSHPSQEAWAESFV
ncbi:B-box zinc finger protein 32 [Actinidia eriantha]|uniref:B-box zinc finger protein 32 n=1 Tax=Actinidia eriantha TaxID=165200 RepID=UPI00258723F9|nr:B-box zinc finger protein 32 [Actinidia eriantha]